MRTATESPVVRTIGRVKELWAEFDYAQRRQLEIQLGLSMSRPAPPKIASSVDELEALYRLTNDPRRR